MDYTRTDIISPKIFFCLRLSLCLIYQKVIARMKWITILNKDYSICYNGQCIAWFFSFFSRRFGQLVLKQRPRILVDFVKHLKSPHNAIVLNRVYPIQCVRILESFFSASLPHLDRSRGHALFNVIQQEKIVLTPGNVI